MKGAKYLHFFMFAGSLFFFIYLFFIQCLRFNHYRQIADKLHKKKVILSGTRGNIYDRNGVALATSEPCFSIFCTPQYARDKEKLALQLSYLSARPLGEIKNLIKDNKFFWVETKASGKKKDAYLKIEDPSIGYTYDLRRIYTMPEIFGSLIGRCSNDNRGIEGIELYFDEILSGKSGFVVYQKEPTGEVIPYYNYPEKNPEAGYDLYLTIDKDLQIVLYSQLRECLIKEEAKTAAGVIINPQNGEVLALVNLHNDGRLRNSVICDEFEPGSTFKIVPLAISLTKGIKETEMFNTEGGRYNINGHIIRDLKDYGIITLSQAIAYSSNVVMAKLAKRFSRNDFFVMVLDFGFTQVTGIEFPGETAGRLLREKKLNEIEFASLMTGYGITCNLLQLAFAYQAVANQGVLNKPLIIYKIMEKEKRLYQSSQLRIRRVIDEDIAGRITSVLCGVIEKGTGTAAKIDGIKVAAKTGTARKVVDRRYSDSRIIVTFVGYFPTDNPDYLIALMIDEPKKKKLAGTIIAPTFKQIAERICQIRNFEYAVK